MRILITNDDGFDAPGLAALHRALRELGDVVVVAPAVCHSAKGHAVDTKSPLKLERRNLEPFGEMFIVHSSPADCIRIGLRHLLVDSPPDLVVSGINPGANLGVDLFYSGTAAAAREAALLGVPAIALSRLIHDDFPIDWEKVAGVANRIVRTLIQPQFQLPGGCVWNVNLPTVQDECYPDEITIVRQGIGPHAIEFRVAESCGNVTLLKYTGAYRDRVRSADCDVAQLFDRRLTATAIGPDLTVELPNLSQSRVSLVDLSCPD